MHQNALKPLLKLTMKMFVVPEQEEEDFGYLVLLRRELTRIQMLFFSWQRATLQYYLVSCKLLKMSCDINLLKKRRALALLVEISLYTKLMYKKYFDIYNRNADISYAFHLRDFDATFLKNSILIVNQENSRNLS